MRIERGDRVRIHEHPLSESGENGVFTVLENHGFVGVHNGCAVVLLRIAEGHGFPERRVMFLMSRVAIYEAFRENLKGI